MPRGRTVRAPELVAEVVRLREQDPPMIFREIGERLGISAKTAHEWYTDPDGSKRDARKDRYRGTCIDCGAPTSGCNGPSRPALRCHQCAAAAEPELWSAGAVIAAIQAWVDVYGDVPTAMDWNPAIARAKGRSDLAERFVRDDSWPYTSTVLDRFGSWNAAIEAAGFQPVRPGERRNPEAWYQSRYGKAAA